MQALAVERIEGPLLIIAGAGSGKTRVITYRMANMLDKGIAQSAILALTFTNKAAREMSERIKELTGRKLKSLTVSTFHAFGVKMLRERIELLGYRPNFSIYDQQDQLSLVKDAGRELGWTRDALDPWAALEVISAVKTGRKRWDEVDDRFRPLYEEYQKSLFAYNSVDFDDLLVLPIRILEERPEIAAEYRERYKYILVDEFQDTSLIQYKLLRLIAGENVCVVGDDDQSIYSWRGASYENIRSFERDYPKLLEIKLEQNYRSTGTILEAANGLIRHNENRKDKSLWSGESRGRPIQLSFPESELDEAREIVEEIKRLSVEEGMRFDQFGVLLRTNSLTRHIEEALLEQDVPYRISGGTSFFERKEVKDVISYLRVIANPDDDINLLRVVNTPRRGIGRKTLELAGQVARERDASLHHALTALVRTEDSPLPEKHRGDVDEFLNLIEHFRGEMLGKKGFGGKVRMLIEHIDYWGHLLGEHPENDKAAKWKYLNVQRLIEGIEQWERHEDTEDPSLFAWLNRVSLITRDDLEDEQAKGKVNVMTIHAAKGLEFDCVFIAGCEDGIIPHARSVEEGGGSLEEERRLFYVAITRARERLYISSCRTRRSMNMVREAAPSPFLDEIPQHLMETCEAAPPGEVDLTAAFARLQSKFGGGNT
jgi:DNA helicase-2/ATP-dependent DNA helicase PcrA